MAEAVGQEDATTEVEEEGERHILQLLLLSLHDIRICGVNTGEVIPGDTFAVDDENCILTLLLSGQNLRKKSKYKTKNHNH